MTCWDGMVDGVGLPSQILDESAGGEGEGVGVGVGVGALRWCVVGR